jgi:hypothetical protein
MASTQQATDHDLVVWADVCRARHDAIDASNKIIIEKIEGVASSIGDLQHRLYIDNGTASLQTRMDRSDQKWTAALWAVGILFVSLVGGMSWVIQRQVERIDKTEQAVIEAKYDVQRYNQQTAPARAVK